ncbi:MAG: hypothetical protein PHY27_14775 [Parabacteroides sp.]|nr:hypothetical protein [Parabacteroides sp.]
MEVEQMDAKSKLYEDVVKATANKHDAEIRKDKEGRFIVYSVKRQRTDKELTSK